MRKEQTVHVLGTCFAMALLMCRASEPSPAKQEYLPKVTYKVNQSKTYKVMFPKSGYVGAPLSTAAVPFLWYPTLEEHFKTCFIRVTIIADRLHKGNQRLVLKIDEVDDKLNNLNEGIYYSYIDIQPEGIKIIYHFKDDNGDHTETGIGWGIPFPFDCARPPQFGFVKGHSDGYRDKSGLGVKYLKKEKKSDTPVVNIEAERFENYEGLGELGSRTAKWYTSEVDDVVKSKETKILYKENQKWASDSEWLWDEMERFDKDGNILMKCKKIL